MPPLKLRLVLEDLYEKPIAAAACTVQVGGKMMNLTTDSTGRLEQDIPPDAHDATLTIQDPQTPFQGVSIPIKSATSTRWIKSAVSRRGSITWATSPARLVEQISRIGVRHRGVSNATTTCRWMASVVRKPRLLSRCTGAEGQSPMSTPASGDPQGSVRP